MENIIAIQQLSKKFGNTQALTNIDLNIKQGEIYGLIGRNGAGKTTLLKTIAGLLPTTAGHIHLFNQPASPATLKRVGCLVETPTAFNELTASQNLHYYCKLWGLIDKNLVAETLQLVDLTADSKKKFKDFSLGMKQKLGLAIALLKKPDLLLLDEPTNGLDPMAIVTFRKLILKLNQEKNMTILISSHVLDELFHVATRFGFINEGQIFQEISKNEFIEASQELIQLQVNDIAKATTVLQTIGINNYKVISENQIYIYDLQLATADINHALVIAGVKVAEIYKEGQTLEDYFKELMNLLGGEK
ncbi:ABC-2 type transport system ATP-binding protein [Enterococcus sp. PF1-24]|uniref:ABC transporter ATP-binding protein n=1 Tax=unclassified Enterococcus TaxID=2608891 RepID=UPI002475B3BC|nr:MULTISPECIES: ABC transporter ATP-binding protein [unclassified Enterococcus]MDH6364790.1 ABC-2 type transport system ATP-binding protein [Enterococcus sp. PFB1-1]MDH6401865.1 ABC-2 type transport system ATP-binding protein [Enterococcus sp. PF1-24]